MFKIGRQYTHDYIEDQINMITREFNPRIVQLFIVLISIFILSIFQFPKYSIWVAVFTILFMMLNWWFNSPKTKK